jgi:ubiquinone/menaquinone biosynthesis C-methylase UbiE
MSERVARSNYDRLGTRFSKRSWAKNEEIAKHIRSLVNLLDGSRWLEAGSGAGDFTRLLSSPGRNVVSLDLSFDMLRSACSHTAKTVAVQGDVSRCPFRPGAFDVVTCRNVLKHCIDIGSAITEMQRVCRPFGHLLVVESCVSNELDRAFMNSVIAVTEPNQTPFLTPMEWIEALTDSGARLVSSTTFTHKVVSTRDYRIEQFDLDEERLERHWNLFANAPKKLVNEKEIRQSSDGVLEFRLLWAATVVQIEGSTGD